QPVMDALTGIDTIPSSDDLNNAWGSQSGAVSGLIGITNDPNVDVGVQLRAIRALANYKSTPTDTRAHDTIAGVLRDHTLATVGSDLLILRASIEALGACPDKAPNDVNVLTPMLNHQSRDIRATTASALRDLGNTNAISELSMRLSVEQVPQVRFA